MFCMTMQDMQYHIAVRASVHNFDEPQICVLLLYTMLVVGKFKQLWPHETT